MLARSACYHIARIPRSFARCSRRHFAADHPIVKLVEAAAAAGPPPLAWLPAAQAALAAREARRAAAEGGAAAEASACVRQGGDLPACPGVDRAERTGPRSGCDALR